MSTCRLCHTLVETHEDLRNVRVMTFSKCVNMVAAGADNGLISIWNFRGPTSTESTARGYLTPFFTAHNLSAILTTDFSPDNSVLISCVYQQYPTPYLISLWNIRKDTIRHCKHCIEVSSLDHERDSIHLVFSGKKIIVLWTLNSPTELRPIETSVWDQTSCSYDKGEWKIVEQDRHPPPCFRMT